MLCVACRRFLVGIVATAFVAIGFTNYKQKCLVFLTFSKGFSFDHWFSIQFFGSSEFFEVDFRMSDG